MYKVALFDLETDGFDYTELLCAAVKGDSDGILLFTKVGDLEDWAHKNTNSETLWVAHNACGFDYWALRDLTNLKVKKEQVVDTGVLTKLVDYRKFITHSLKEIGEYLRVHKGDYEGGFDRYTPEMGEYCKQDVEVLSAIWSRYCTALTRYPVAVKVEHEVSFLCKEMQVNGFKFNEDNAKKLLAEVKDDMGVLEDAIQKEWPPELVVDRKIQWRTKEDGTPYATCLKAMDQAPKWVREGTSKGSHEQLVLYRYKEFNPASSKDRVDKLWEAGWKPYDKTKGHIKHEREKKWR